MSALVMGLFKTRDTVDAVHEIVIFGGSHDKNGPEAHPYQIQQTPPGAATKILESIQPEFQKIENPNIKHVVSVLLNLIAMLASDNARLNKRTSFIKMRRPICRAAKQQMRTT